MPDKRLCGVDGCARQHRANGLCQICNRRKYYQENSEKVKERQRKYREENPEKVKERHRKYYQENSEKEKERLRKYYQENSEKEKERQRKYKEENPEKVKECQRKYYQENQEKVKKRRRKYKEENPEKVKECQRKYNEENQEKVKERQRKYREENPEKVKEIVRKWKEENPDKVKAYGVNSNYVRRIRELNTGAPLKTKLTAGGLDLLIQRQDFRCASCNKDITQDNHLDHMIPLSRGGTNSMDNVQYLCSVCNLTKGKKTPLEWVLYKKKKEVA